MSSKERNRNKFTEEQTQEIVRKLIEQDNQKKLEKRKRKDPYFQELQHQLQQTKNKYERRIQDLEEYNALEKMNFRDQYDELADEYRYQKDRLAELDMENAELRRKYKEAKAAESKEAKAVEGKEVKPAEGKVSKEVKEDNMRYMIDQGLNVDEIETYRYLMKNKPSVVKAAKTQIVKNRNKETNYINPEDLKYMTKIPRDYIFERLGISNKPNPNREKVKEQTEKSDLDQFVQDIVDKEFDKKKNQVINKTSEIHEDIYFKYNSFNILIGPQGAAKTTTALTELIKLSQVPHDYHLILFVSDTPDDVTRSALSNYVKTPMIMISYKDIEEKFEKLMKLKEKYNAMIDKKIDKDAKILESLYITDFKKKRLHTAIVFDDAAFIFEKNTKSKFKKWLCQLRHLNVTAFCCLQSWGQISPELKTQLSTVYLFKGFSRERLGYIHRQITTGLDFEQFYAHYNDLKQYQKMIVDCKKQVVKIV